MNIRPELLNHPNIPKPLHGISPRVVKGKDWWDIARKKAYASTDYYCAACGVHKNNAKYHRWLEAHEIYDYYNSGTKLIMKEIVPLCHACHNFIHDGRLYMIAGKEKSVYQVWEIFQHGFRILRENEITPYVGHVATYFRFIIDFQDELNVSDNYINALRYRVNKLIEDSLIDPNNLEDDDNYTWEDYHMIIDGEVYYSRFDSYEDWYAHYNS